MARREHRHACESLGCVGAHLVRVRVGVRVRARVRIRVRIRDSLHRVGEQP